MSLVAGAMLAGTAVSAYGAHKANKANQQMSREQMKFQERMSSTAHQREVKDLRLAGLNPSLSAMGGQGASAPTGAMAQAKNELESAGPSAMQMVMNLKQLEKLDAETKNIQTDTKVKGGKSVIEGTKGDLLTGLKNLITGNETHSAKQIRNKITKRIYKKGREIKKSSIPYQDTASTAYQHFKKNMSSKFNKFKKYLRGK